MVDDFSHGSAAPSIVEASEVDMVVWLGGRSQETKGRRRLWLKSINRSPFLPNGQSGLNGHGAYNNTPVLDRDE